MSIRSLAFALLLATSMGAADNKPAVPIADDAVPSHRFEADGVSVVFLTSHPVEGDEVDLRFQVRSNDGTQLTGIRPAAWIDSHGAKEEGSGCKDKIQSFLGGSLRARPVVDLNSYYVVTLNAEPSIAVIDPLVGFGGSKLLTAVNLQSTGVDWALSRDQKLLFVSMPQVNRVAVIDTEQWEVVRNIDTPFKPGRLSMQENGNVWVASEAALTVIDPKKRASLASIPLGRAPHHLAFTPDGRYAAVTNGADGTVSIIDAQKRTKVADITVGSSLTGIAGSSLSSAAYVIDAGGSIAVLDLRSRSITKRIEAKAGLNSIQFAPGGRWGFVTNSRENVVHILDSATATIVTTAKDVGKGPDQVAFTEDFAYVRAADSDQVKMIRLAGLGTDAEANIATFPGGQLPPSAADAPSFASAIVPAPEPKAVLVANPADRLVYYYTEGMAAPMGNFSAVRRSPKAALVIDRSLRETAPGVFSIRTKAPNAGQYDVAFFLNAPRVVHCFDLTVHADPGRKQVADRVAVKPLIEKKPILAGQELEVKFRLTNARTNELHRDVRDLRALALRSPGDWQQSLSARATEDGLYSVKLSVPKPGIYYVYVESPSLHLNVNDGRPLIFEATGK